MGESMKAKQCYEAALQLTPDHPMAMAMIGLGLIAQKQGDLPEAVRQYSHAMAVQPTDVGYLLLARALEQAGRLDEAQAISERVARLSPNLAEALGGKPSRWFPESKCVIGYSFTSSLATTPSLM